MIIVAAYAMILAHPGPVFGEGAKEFSTYEKIDRTAGESTALDSFIPRSSSQHEYRGMEM